MCANKACDPGKISQLVKYMNEDISIFPVCIEKPICKKKSEPRDEKIATAAGQTDIDLFPANSICPSNLMNPSLTQTLFALA
jgi:hypothetical protein